MIVWESQQCSTNTAVVTLLLCVRLTGTAAGDTTSQWDLLLKCQDKNCNAVRRMTLQCMSWEALFETWMGNVLYTNILGNISIEKLVTGNTVGKISRCHLPTRGIDQLWDFKYKFYPNARQGNRRMIRSGRFWRCCCCGRFRKRLHDMWLVETGECFSRLTDENLHRVLRECSLYEVLYELLDGIVGKVSGPVQYSRVSWTNFRKLQFGLGSQKWAFGTDSEGARRVRDSILFQP